jgi:hypothetical protein
MKLNIIPTNKLALLSAAVCAVMLAFSHSASALRIPMPPTINLTIGDGQTLGYVNFGIPSGDQDRTNYVNHLVFMYNNGITNDPSFLGQSYHIVNGAPALGASLPNAVFALDGGTTSINLGSGLYSYLFAKYDGRNAGSVVWYVGNLSGIINIPSEWVINNHGYGLSGWTLFGPGGQVVPDGGATIMLLGAALGALGMARRYLMS